jgi:polysaccharide biosynthesis protein PslH
MRILFVSPYPPSRIRVRGYGLLTQLAAKHEVTIVAQCASEQERADAEALRRQGFEVVTVDESKRQAAIRGGLAALSARSSCEMGEKGTYRALSKQDG